MNKRQQTWVTLAAIAVGTAGGYLATGERAAPPPTSRQESVTSHGRPRRHAAADSRRIRSASLASRKPGRIDRSQALMDYYASLNSTQLAAEANKIDRLPPSEMLVASFLLFSRWGEIDPIAALERAGKSQSGASLKFLIPSILRSWASVDPKAAGEYTRTHSGGFAAIRPASIAAELAWQDPDAAVEWAKSLEPKDSFAGVSVLRELAKSDPARAWALAADIDAGIRFRAYEEIAGQWAAKDFATAERQIGKLDGDTKNSALSAAVQALARIDPKQAARQLSKIQGQVPRHRADVAVMESMARLFPGETADIPPLQPGDQVREDEGPEAAGMGEEKRQIRLLADPNFASWYLEYNS